MLFLPPAGCWGDLPRCCRQQTLKPLTHRGRCELRLTTRGGGLRSASSRQTRVCGASVGWSFGSPLGLKMLTDMILEEEFEKNGESWYNQQELEHGKSRSALRSHPNSDCVCVGRLCYSSFMFYFK